MDEMDKKKYFVDGGGSGDIPKRANAPIIEPNGGTFTDPIKIILKHASPYNGHIRYTLNGDEPTQTNGIIYDKPFNLSANTVVKAIAYQTPSRIMQFPSEITVAEFIYEPPLTINPL